MTMAPTLDPALDVRGRIADQSGLLEPLNKIWFHKTAAAVIDADRCVRCGSCIAACPSQSISVAADGLPTLTRMCTGCSRCWDFCPLAGMRSERLWRIEEGESSEVEGVRPLRAAYEARAAEPIPGAQDGGVVTAILEALLAAGEIDGVLLTRSRGPFKGEAVIARTADEIRACAGSVYDQTLPLAQLDPRKVEGLERLAMVGTPCQVTGLRALQRFGWEYREDVAHRVRFTFALFCTRSFDGLKLMRELLVRGLPVGEVTKIACAESKLRVYGKEQALLLEAPVKEFRAAALRGCDECADFTGRLADIAVGSVGSPEGSTTVFVRNEAGERAWNVARAALSYGELTDAQSVGRQEERNRRRASRNLKRDFDPEAPLWISYEEHLEDYLETDRAPVTPPPHRSHHYEVAC